MLVPRLSVVVAMLGLVAGCSPSPSRGGSSASTAVGPHGGYAVPMPDMRGYAEVVIEVLPQSAGVDMSAQVAVYFLQPDLTRPLAPEPTGVSVKLLIPQSPPQIVPLTRAPKENDPCGAARFASSPGPYLVDEPIGELSATIDGKSIVAAFASVR